MKKIHFNESSALKVSNFALQFWLYGALTLIWHFNSRLCLILKLFLASQKGYNRANLVFNEIIPILTPSSISQNEIGA
jgi:hypothetical protein